MIENTADEIASAPWGRLPGEPPRWHGRFAVYRDLGRERSLLRACGKRSVPLTWYDAAEDYHWRERAQSWDGWQRDQLALTNKAETEENKAQRLTVLKALRAKLVTALKATEPVESPWRDIATGLLSVTNQLRAEAGGD